jgi:hypothetical protein
VAVEASAAPDGTVEVVADRYRLAFPRSRPYAVVADADGAPWLELCLAWSVDRIGQPDTTLDVAPPALAPTAGGTSVTVGIASSAWAAKRLRFECSAASITVTVEVQGSGRLADLGLGGGWWAGPGRAAPGWLASGRSFESVFSPEPGPLDRFAAPAATPMTIDAMGGSLPGRGHWFFTPPPYAFGFSRSPSEPGVVPDGPWLTAGLAPQPGAATFTSFEYAAAEEAWSFRLAYEGHTAIDGAWTSPSLVMAFDAPDPYAGVVAYRAILDARRGVARRSGAARPEWWSRPIFCGWGSQAHLATTLAGADPATEDATAVAAPDLSRQEHYDAFLGALRGRGLVPGTIVIDDKWQLSYGANEPDPAKWPDLRAWIEARHAAGQRVLRWWKAWDPEGLPGDQCVRTPRGRPVAADPDSPAYAAGLADTVRRMLSPDGLDADGLKIDFTAQTPSGPDLVHHGPRWGMELLHRLLEIVYQAAKDARPDALIIGHAPNPDFVDVADMVRLNDALRLSDPRPWKPVVPQMLHRARIARAAVPELLVDSDDWAMPDLATWREFQRAKAGLGVPSLYYATHIDQSGEALGPEDDALLRELWEAPRSAMEA